jgi:quercetin dioxygenase-like cupin family protein
MLVKRRKVRQRKLLNRKEAWSARNTFNKKVEKIESACLQEEVEQPACITKHHFSPGIYVRELFMPAGSLIVGHAHKTEHMNIVMSGRACIMCGEEKQIYVKAGDVFKSGIGVRKILQIYEDMTWITTHASDKTTVDEVEEDIFRKSRTFLRACNGLKAMNALELREKQKQIEKEKDIVCLG